MLRIGGRRHEPHKQSRLSSRVKSAPLGIDALPALPQLPVHWSVAVEPLLRDDLLDDIAQRGVGLTGRRRFPMPRKPARLTPLNYRTFVRR